MKIFPNFFRISSEFQTFLFLKIQNHISTSFLITSSPHADHIRNHCIRDGLAWRNNRTALGKSADSAESRVHWWCTDQGKSAERSRFEKYFRDGIHRIRRKAPAAPSRSSVVNVEVSERRIGNLLSSSFYFLFLNKSEKKIDFQISFKNMIFFKFKIIEIFFIVFKIIFF